jgi:hypothetical protein
MKEWVMYMYKPCTWTWSCLHLKKANKFELWCCCSSITKEEHRGNRSLRVFEMGMALSQTKFYPFCELLDIVLWGSIYHMGQSLWLANQSQSYICPFGEYCIFCVFDMVIWFQNEKVQSLWLANQSQLCFFTGPFWRILYLVHVAFDSAIWLQNEMGQSLWLVNQRKLYFFMGPFWRILYLVPMPRTNFILNWFTKDFLS